MEIFQFPHTWPISSYGRIESASAIHHFDLLFISMWRMRVCVCVFVYVTEHSLVRRKVEHWLVNNFFDEMMQCTADKWTVITQRKQEEAKKQTKKNKTWIELSNNRLLQMTTMPTRCGSVSTSSGHRTGRQWWKDDVVSGGSIRLTSTPSGDYPACILLRPGLSRRMTCSDAKQRNGHFTLDVIASPASNGRSFNYNVLTRVSRNLMAFDGRGTAWFSITVQ